MGTTPIEMTGVTKAFKKHAHKKKFLTLKSSLIRDIWKGVEADENLFWALKGIDLSVRQGETIGLIGSNGSGKSTLLKVMAGILQPTQGSVSIHGRLSALIELGAGFHPEISGRENVFINGIMLGLTKQEINRKFKEIVDFAELWEFIDNPVRTYSSGMFMRLGFAVAVHVNPDILLIDEVLAVGDQSFIHKCLERIFDFKRRKKTIVVVSHDLGAIEKLCSRVMWLSNGETQMAGQSREVIGAYLMSVAKKEEARFASEHQQIMDSLDELSRDNTGEVSGAGDGTTQDEESQSGETEGKRWGTREVEISKVRVFDKDSRERYVFQTGEPVVVQLDYVAKKVIERPVFGIGFHLRDGTWCFGSNTFLEKIRIQSVQGSGSIRLEFPSLNFTQNTYLISVAVHGEDETPYDYHDRLYTIAFRSEINDSGIFRPDHQWRFDPNIKLEESSEEVSTTEEPG